ncbi:MAG: YceI family protein [Bryobacteraceae bacterium]
MKIRYALVTLAWLAIPAFAGQYSLDLKPDNTTVEWTLGDALHTVHGTFRLKSGRIAFDSDTGAASGEVLVDVTSGQSGSEARDRRMQANVLESAKYPEAVFIPSGFEGKVAVPGTSNVKLHGTFRIHGAAHEMTMTVQTVAAEEQVSATLGFEVPYVAWGMKDPSNFLLKVSKSVQCAIHFKGPLTKD